MSIANLEEQNLARKEKGQKKIEIPENNREEHFRNVQEIEKQGQDFGQETLDLVESSVRSAGGNEEDRDELLKQLKPLGGEEEKIRQEALQDSQKEVLSSESVEYLKAHSPENFQKNVDEFINLKKLLIDEVNDKNGVICSKEDLERTLKNELRKKYNDIHFNTMAFDFLMKEFKSVELRQDKFVKRVREREEAREKFGITEIKNLLQTNENEAKIQRGEYHNNLIMLRDLEGESDKASDDIIKSKDQEAIKKLYERNDILLALIQKVKQEENDLQEKLKNAKDLMKNSNDEEALVESGIEEPKEDESVIEEDKEFKEEEKLNIENMDDEEVVKEFFSYNDVLKKDKNDIPMYPNQERYVKSLRETMQQESFDSVLKKIKTNFESSMRKLSLPSSIFGKSNTWVYWDIAKQDYFSKNRDKADSKYDVGDPLLSEEIQQQISDRHLGWEVYGAVSEFEDGERKFEDKNFLERLNKEDTSYKKILELLNKKAKADNATLSSLNLEKLGRYVRKNLE